MLKNRDLRGLARGLAETFASRNNDVDGYWGIGMLYQEAIDLAANHVEFDLISGQASPSGTVSRSIAASYSAYISNRLDGLPIAAGNITVNFGTFGDAPEPHFYSYGDPFVCVVRLVSTAGKEYLCTRTGRCAPHSINERQSSRAGL